MEQLHERFAEVARERMLAAGWIQDEGADTSPDGRLIAAFHRPAVGKFAMTACFVREPFDPESSPLVVRAVLGMRHPPADRLLGLLGEPPRCAIAREVGGLLDPPRDSPVRVERPAEIADAVETLGRLIDTHADRYATEHASVEALIEGWNAREPFSATSLAAYSAELRACATVHVVAPVGMLGVEALPAVLLAATGRPDEARAALADAVADHEDLPPAGRRFARRLTHWLDTGGTVPDEHDAGPYWLRWDGRTRERPSFAEAWRKSRARKEAIDAVRQTKHGKTRAQLRAQLEAELTRRGLDRDAIRIELQIDEIEHPPTPLDRARGALRGVESLIAFGRSIKDIFDDSFEPPPQPDWLEPPEHAAYDLQTTGEETTTVDLDDNVEAWLDRALHASRFRFGDFAGLEVWLAWDSTPPQPDSHLVVHIGERRVGTLDRDATERLRPVMTTAATLDELPRTRAQLVRLGRPHRPFLLAIHLPRRNRSE
jgi:hypothetical protein